MILALCALVVLSCSSLVIVVVFSGANILAILDDVEKHPERYLSNAP